MTDQEKSDYVRHKILTCLIDIDILKSGEKYMLEYIALDIYIGRSENIYGKRIHIKPDQLNLLIEEK